MSTALTTLTSKLAAKLDMGTDGSDLIETLKATAFKGEVSNAQMTALMVVANQYGLNPWTKEIYAFPDKNNGIVPVVGVDGWARIINDNPQFDGMDFAQSDEMVRMPGANSDAPAWIECAMYRKDRTRPVIIREYLDEVYREPFKGKFGPVIGAWQTHPKRFLRHKAMIQCARMAFGYGGIFDQDEAERITERDMGAAEVVSSRPAQPAALPDYSQSAFADNLPKWSALMQSGAKTADQIIAIVSTKGALSEAQKAAIRAAAQPKPAPDPEPEIIDAPEQKAQADDDGWIEDYESTEAGQ
ncbi:MAG TPA: phage recombination protein Bet [Rubrivivax sp.]|nr:phage recombination protein Bet [Rubrivivax sp.]